MEIVEDFACEAKNLKIIRDFAFLSFSSFFMCFHVSVFPLIFASSFFFFIFIYINFFIFSIFSIFFFDFHFCCSQFFLFVFHFSFLFIFFSFSFFHFSVRADAKTI